LISILYSVLIGLLGGVLSTIAMTISEIPSWKKWGLLGVFEWHENQIITVRLFHISDLQHIHFKGIFLFHFLNGALAGIAFPFISSFFTSVIHYIMPFSLLGILYSIALWILTLVPIHKPITGLSPWSHPLGHLPLLASLGGHIVYGILLGVVVSLSQR
jgi:hypothetical protein